MKVKDILAVKGSRVVTIAEYTSVFDAMTVFSANRIGSLIVVDKEENILGIICARDVLMATLNHLEDIKTMKIDKIMTTSLIVARENDDLDYLPPSGQNSDQKRALVVDDSLTARKVLAKILQKHDFATCEVGDGIEAIERLRVKEDADFRADRAVERGPTRENALTEPARKHYLEWLLRGSGRAVEDGAPGTWMADPVLSAEQRNFDDDDWAQFWLRLGGFEPSIAGANLCDPDGWTGLHYALLATVVWEQAHRIARGLIPMMSVERLRAKTKPMPSMVIERSWSRRTSR